MSALDRTHARNILDASLGVAAFVATTTVSGAAGRLRCRFMTALGSETANGTELGTGGGYTSGTGAPTVDMGAANASAQAVSTTAVTVTNMPGTGVAGVELWDAAGTPARKWWGALTGGTKTVVAGDTFSIAAGALQVNNP